MSYYYSYTIALEFAVMNWWWWYDDNAYKN